MKWIILIIVVLVVLLGDAVLVSATHVVALWMRAPR